MTRSKAPTPQFELRERLSGRLRLARTSEGRALEVEVEGVVLEGQLALSSGEFVLWSSEDCPFEETLHITLVSPEGQVLETATLGEAMQPGVFANFETLSDGVVAFDFFPQQRHRLEVRSEPRGLLSSVFRRRRLHLASWDKATTDDDST